MKTPFEQLAEAMSNQSLILEDIAKSYAEQANYTEAKLIHARAAGWREAAYMLLENKGIEKEVIVETSKNSYIAGYLDNQAKVDDSMNFPEDYYNETFNTKEK